MLPAIPHRRSQDISHLYNLYVRFLIPRHAALPTRLVAALIVVWPHIRHVRRHNATKLNVNEATHEVLQVFDSNRTWKLVEVEWIGGAVADDALKAWRAPRAGSAHLLTSVQRSMEVHDTAESANPDSILQARRRFLQHAIDEIDEQIAARRWLNERFSGQVQKELEIVLHHLSLLPSPWSGGYLTDREFLRTSLHKNAVSRKREMRQEELKLWEDLARLLEKRRELALQLEQLRATDRPSAPEADD